MTKFVPGNASDFIESANSEGETLREAVAHALIRILPGFLNAEVFDTYTLALDLSQWLTASGEDVELDNYRRGSDYLAGKEARQ